MTGIVPEGRDGKPAMTEAERQLVTEAGRQLDKARATGPLRFLTIHEEIRSYLEERSCDVDGGDQ